MKGYIGIFDILGYQTFLEHNQNESALGTVLDQITSIGKSIPELLRAQYKPFFTKAEGKEILPKINWLVFSDTIVITLQSDTLNIPEHIAVLMTAKELMFQMCNYGLPLRGALHYGDFLLVDHSMAGRGIVETIRRTVGLNFSGCVLTQEMKARTDALEAQSNDPHFSQALKGWFLCDYNVPFSNDKRERLTCLMWFDANSASRTFEAGDIRNFVHNKFWAHGKDLPDSRAVEKLEETERFIRYCHARQQPL